MQLTQNTIMALILALLPLTGLALIYIYMLMERESPMQQRAALQQFAQYGVHMIEQMYADEDSGRKRLLAEDIVKDLFKAMKLPVPHDALIDAAIESAVFVMNQHPTQQQAKLERTDTQLARIIGSGGAGQVGLGGGTKKL